MCVPSLGEGDAGGIGIGIIIGAALGGLIALLICCCAMFLCVAWRRRKRRTKEAEEGDLDKGQVRRAAGASSGGSETTFPHRQRPQLLGKVWKSSISHFGAFFCVFRDFRR
jgi:hypothetical protein